ncbi:MAG: response regulator transcription factor [Deltaproteobacteria bacterium]|nr:response regulator transcription factor [Deltaproteobacteria bacterium]
MTVTRARILVVEDDASIRAGLELNLGAEGYEVAAAVTGEQALEIAKGSSPELIILDIMLPKMSGFDVLERLRRDGWTGGVVVLSARGHELDKVTGLQLGADDYLTKPFGLSELLARVAAVLRRTRAPAADCIRFSDVEVDLRRREVRKASAVVPMTKLEFDLLVYLARNAGRTLERAQILREVWQQAAGTGRTVDNFVAQLRQKLEDDPDSPRHLVTLRGVGYRFDP